MQASTLISLRANAVLIALCVAASDAAWLAICGCSGHPHALESPLVRMAIVASAAAIVIAMRRLARLAFDAARATRQIACPHDAGDRIVIDRSCSHDWLVQLHVELHPVQARDCVSVTCARAMPSCRCPRGRA
jgi:hypothetical protein